MVAENGLSNTETRNEDNKDDATITMFVEGEEECKGRPPSTITKIERRDHVNWIIIVMRKKMKNPFLKRTATIHVTGDL